jgi:iron complex transport system permease protein
VPRRALLILLLLTPLILILALASGSVPLTLLDLQSIVGASPTPAATIVLELRLPRVVAAFTVGGLLALAGVYLQIVTTNPLADPYLLGIAGGAAVGTLLGEWWLGGIVTPLLAGWLGAILAAILTLIIGQRERAGSNQLLLTGVALAAGWGAILTLLLIIAPEAALRGILFWLLGDLSHAGQPWPALLLLLIALPLSLLLAPQLNLLRLGPLRAATLGVAIKPLQIALLLLTALLTSAAVTLGGPIGFIGLMIPHLARQWIGSDHRILIPTALLLGGALLTTADTLARTITAPQQLPVGALIALLGVPFFLYLLRRRQS